MSEREDRAATAELAEKGMKIHEIDRTAFRAPAASLWKEQSRALGAEAWLQAALAG